ncbi:MAG: NAD(P)H-dependent oxidoreductase [Actinobacteria bacterium]|nr:NAD(P)H-dependent oxidoreductase [Actinomycetota bacterium]
MSIALIVGHPDLSTSRVNAALTEVARSLPEVDTRILGALTADGALDVRAEQSALEAVDDIVLLYPTYWYSPPALLKRWLDEVLVRGWAYGTGAPGALAGKTLRIVTTTGGVRDGYRDGELHSFEYDAILAPLKATAHRLGLTWREPLVIHGVREIDDAQLADLGAAFERILSEPSVSNPRELALVGQAG